MKTPSQETWVAIKDDELTIRQKDVLRPKSGYDSQRHILELAIDEDQSKFCRYFLELGIEGSNKVNAFPRCTESEFLDPPWSFEQQIWDCAPTLSERAASTPGFWARLCIQAIQEQVVVASSFATESRSSKDSNGRARITQALNSENKNEIIACTRRIFRVMGGILSDRGYRTSFLDCPIARAWWRHRMARLAAEVLGSESLTKEYSQLLRTTHIWEPLIEHVTSKQTVIGFTKVLAVLIDEFAHMAHGDGTSKDKVKQKLVFAGSQCSLRALDLLDSEQVLKVICGRNQIWTPEET